MKKLIILLSICFILTSAVFAAPVNTAPVNTAPVNTARPIVVFMSDFGLDNDSVGLCHGVMLAINPDIEIVDLCHNIQPYNILQASLALKRTGLFPKGSVFVGVVDPGVGTARKSIAVKTRKGLFYIAPNNGLLSFVIQQQGIDKVYELEHKKINPRWCAGTFDGRDLYGPAAAMLASSGGDLNRIGKSADKKEIILLDLKNATIYPYKKTVIGIHLETDGPYGNIWTNITKSDLEAIGAKKGATLRVSSAKFVIDAPLVTAFGDVKKGAPLAYISSGNSLALAINMGNFKKTYQIKEGDQITVSVKK